MAAHSDGLGRGRLFTVRLPVGQMPARDAKAHAQAGAAPQGPKLRILVAGDRPDTADSLTMMLGILGHDVRIAYDGQRAVEIAAAHRPDVVLLDIGMPGLNGYEAARRIRAQPWGQAATLIALTGWGQEDDRRRSAAAGFDHHLVKPADIGALMQLLSSCGTGARPR